MRTGRLLTAGRWAVICLTGALPCSAVHAQVTINNQALESLGKPTHHHAPRRATRRPLHTAPASRPAPPPRREPQVEAVKPPAPPAEPEIPASALPKVPTTPPAILALPPPVVVPLAHPPPAPVIPEAKDAPGTATPIRDGVRVTFGAGRSELNPATVAALRAFARGLLDRTGTSINIYAYAAGSADDPSTPRRLSLERALAARAVLMDVGIASPRIYPRALGPAGGGAEPNRVDVVAGSPTPPAVQGPVAEGHAR